MRKEAQKDQCTCPRSEFIYQVCGSWDLIPKNSPSHLGQVVPFRMKHLVGKVLLHSTYVGFCYVLPLVCSVRATVKQEKGLPVSESLFGCLAVISVIAKPHTTPARKVCPHFVGEGTEAL